MANIDFKRIILFIIMASSLFSLSAQRRYKQGALLNSITSKIRVNHEIGIHLGGGLSTLQYNTLLNPLKSGKGGGGELGANYTYLFGRYAQYVGLGLGTSLAIYTAQAQGQGLYFETSDLIDADDWGSYIYDLRTTFGNYKERQYALYLNFPFFIQFQSGGVYQFYAKIGGKVAIPLIGGYKVKNGTIENKGYYPEFDNEVTSPAFMGFGTFSNQSEKGRLHWKIAFMASAEMGLKVCFSRKLLLYTGIYIDYGFNDVAPSGQLPLLQCDTKNPALFSVNSFLSSTNHTGQKLTSRVNLLSMGLKVQFAFGFEKIDMRSKRYGR
jgi:hypothetical protein